MEKSWAQTRPGAKTPESRGTGHLDGGSEVLQCAFGSRRLDALLRFETWECDFSANGYRLPTEAEWEYACRAGSASQYYFGSRGRGLKPTPGLRATPNPSPMSLARESRIVEALRHGGQPWEWCNDYYGTKYYRNSPTKIHAVRARARSASCAGELGRAVPTIALPGRATATNPAPQIFV